MLILGKIVADFRTQLNSKILATEEACSIESILTDDGDTIPNGNYFFTIDGDSSQKEHIMATLTAKVGGGADLTNIKSISRLGVDSVGVVREHRVGATITVTDWAIMKAILNLLDGTSDFDADVPLGYDGNPILVAGSNKFATVKYVDDTAIAGSPKATEATFGLTRLSKAAADPVTPIAVGDNDDRVPTQTENDALPGTSGTPSTTNKFVTENDTSNYSTITAGTISFTAGTKTIGDSGSGFVTSNFRAGDSIVVSGSASNNGTFTIVSVAAGAIVVAESLTGELAGASVTITTVTANKVYRLKSNGKIDATKLEGDLPAISGANLTGVLASNLDKYSGLGEATTNKTRWNYQLPFSSFSHSNAAITSYTFYATRTVSSSNNYSAAAVYNGQFTPLYFATKNFAVEFFMKLNSTGTNTVKAGFNDLQGFYGAYNETTYDCAEFSIAPDGKLYSHVANGTNSTVTEITGITLTSWNRYRIEVDAAGECRFYVNGVLKDTRTTNVPNGNLVNFGLGGSGSATNLVDTISLPEFSVAI